MMNRNICPLCESEGLEKIERSKVIYNSFTSNEVIPIVEYRCPICGAVGDLFDDNDHAIEAAINSANIRAISNILDELKDINYSMSAIERAFSLTSRILSKWKSGSSVPSKSGEALLKLIGTLPWLIEIAENNYDLRTAQLIHCHSAVSTILTTFSPTGQQFYDFGYIRAMTIPEDRLNYFSDEENVTPDFEILDLPYSAVST